MGNFKVSWCTYYTPQTVGSCSTGALNVQQQVVIISGMS